MTENKDYLTKNAALLMLDTGIEIDTDEDGLIVIDGTMKYMPTEMVDVFRLNPSYARLMAEALLENASLAEGGNLLRLPSKGRA
ncbi:hypothetical protein [Microvirga sp. VF16]|uniref:hypothetical protein n=1 Tax=Microvirga sp. VF16 TaxID=2807101 RepID=UPI00193D8515|nr:hypothetical protein [Microvirga sp. VF16]QRM28701.1 hypothetical protein JO965_21125 [Microvirga sp. VF16]